MATVPEHFAKTPERCLRFGDFELDLTEEALRRDGERLCLNPRMFQVLNLLIERKGEIVRKDEFFEKVWGGSFVEDNNLTVTIAALRRVLGDNAKQAQFIENVPRKGYRFIADVVSGEVSAEEAAGNPPLQQMDGQSRKNSAERLKRRRVFGAVAILVALISIVGAAALTYRRTTFSAARAEKGFDSVAVLPFESLDVELEYIADGLSEGVVDKLSGFTAFRVIGQKSSMSFKSKDIDPVSAGRRLGVGALITGRVDKAGELIVVTAEMTDVLSGTKLWSREFGRPAGELLALQKDIADAVIQTAFPVTAGTQPAFRSNRPTSDPEAYELYLKGRYLWNKRSDFQMNRSIDLFRAAIDRDPTFAKAYIALANAYSLTDLTQRGISDKERIRLAKGAIERALEIDEYHGAAYSARAINRCFIDWDMKGAESDYRKAVELSPNDPTAHHWFAEYLAMKGRFDESFAQYEIAISLDPLSLPIRTDMALNYYYARDLDKAIELLQAAKELDPAYPRTYQFLFLAYREKGELERAVESLEQQQALLLDLGELTAETFEKNRRYAAALREGIRTGGTHGFWTEEFKNGPNEPYYKAVSLGKLGRREEALVFLEKALESRYSGMVWLKVAPELESLRTDHRYHSITNAVGL